MLNKLYAFCKEGNYAFPHCDSAAIVEFLCSIADASERPQSQIKCAMAAVSHMCKAVDYTLPNTSEIHFMVQALIKSSTTAPRKRSKVLPVTVLLDFFRAWPNNNELDTKRLRMKTLTLLALVLMLRPSDVAPKAKTFDPWSWSSCPVVFAKQDVVFRDDGHAYIWIHGTKNDTDRAGFQIDLAPHRDLKLDPVTTLQTYIARTDSVRPSDTQPVFLTLHKPHKAISAGTVATILQDMLKLARLYPEYTAKDFRPTGATYLVQSGFDPDLVMQIGRWKTRSIFFEHYVHAKMPDNLSELLLT